MELNFKTYAKVTYSYYQLAELDSEVVDGKITYKKGDYLIQDIYGNRTLAKKEHIEKNYIEVIDAVYVENNTEDVKELEEVIEENIESENECQK